MKNPSMRYEEELSRRKATGAFGFPESGGARVSGEKGMTAEPLRINLNAGPVAPKHWNVSGSRFQRSSTPWKPMMDAFPEYCDRSRLGQYSIREFEVMRPGVYRGNRVFEATEEKMRQFEANFNPSDRPPLQIDHRLSALDTHGEILDVLTVPANAGEPAKTFVLTIFKGDYCCERVNDGRWHRFSLGFFEKPSATIYELSIVTKQAVPTARLSEGPGFGKTVTALLRRTAAFLLSMNPKHENPVAAGPDGDEKDLAKDTKPAPAVSVATLKAELEEYRVKYDQWRKLERADLESQMPSGAARHRDVSQQKQDEDRAMLRKAFGLPSAEVACKPKPGPDLDRRMLREAFGLEPVEVASNKQEVDQERAMLREAFGIAPVQESSKRPENTDKSELAMLRKAAGLE